MASQSPRQKAVVKILVLGDSSVGKTCLLNRFVNSEFSEKYKPNIGADFLSKEAQVDDKLATLQIWDTAGQERYAAIVSSFFRGTDAVMLVYDVTKAESFRKLAFWRQLFLKETGISAEEQFPFVVVGNKNDRPHHEHTVPAQQVRDWCRDNGVQQNYTTSALTGENVEESFMCIAREAIKRQGTETVTVPGRIDPSAWDNNDSGGCSC